MSIAKCIECKHAQWQTTASGRIKKGEHGRCAAQLPALPVYLCVHEKYSPHKGGIWPDTEGRCDAFEPIEPRHVLPGQVDMGEVWEAAQ